MGSRDVQRARMQHHGGDDVVEYSGVEQQHFSAPGLFGRGSEQSHRQPQLIGHVGQRKCCADRRCGDDVVTARVSDTGERVVLGADPDDQRATAVVGPEGGVQAAGRLGDLETVVGDQRLRLRAAAVFGERELGFGVNRMRTAPPDRRGVG